MLTAIISAAIFLLLGILIIKFFHDRDKNAERNVEEIAKTHYYDLLESINRLHRGRKNPEQLANLSDQISDFDNTYFNLPTTARRAIRLRTDLQLKEHELRKQRVVEALTRPVI